MMSMDALLTARFQDRQLLATPRATRPPPRSIAPRASSSRSPGWTATSARARAWPARSSSTRRAAWSRRSARCQLKVPAVIRLGGNAEEKAIEILHRLHARPAGAGRRLRQGRHARLLRGAAGKAGGRGRPVPDSTRVPSRAQRSAKKPYRSSIPHGHASIRSRPLCAVQSKVCVKECVPQILKEDRARPAGAQHHAGRGEEGQVHRVPRLRGGVLVPRQQGRLHRPAHRRTRGVSQGLRAKTKPTCLSGLSKEKARNDMAILMNRNAVSQGITGREGMARAKLMQDYGTKLVAGCTPGQGGAGCPGRARLRHRQRGGGEAAARSTSPSIFVPAPLVKRAALEAH